MTLAEKLTFFSKGGISHRIFVDVEEFLFHNAFHIYVLSKSCFSKAGFHHAPVLVVVTLTPDLVSPCVFWLLLGEAQGRARLPVTVLPSGLLSVLACPSVCPSVL